MKKARSALGEYMQGVSRTHKEQKCIEGRRGDDKFMRQHQLKKMKEKHVVKLIDEKIEDAYKIRLHFTKVNQTFID